MYDIFEQLLQKNGVTPYKVSKETGIATATLSDWKNGRSVPKQDKLLKIAEYFGVTMDYLMGTDKKEENDYYYLNDETRKIAQEAFDNKDMRMLFYAARNIKPEVLKAHIDLMKTLKDKEDYNE